MPDDGPGGAESRRGGATTFVFDRGEVFGWRMTIQGSAERILDSVLPHEVTHMIFATHFRRPLPRWADEGGATSMECPSEKQKHRTMLVQFLHTQRGIAFGQLFAMTEYPQDVMPLYAEGYSLAEYMIQHGGRKKYVEFLDDGLKTEQWPAAVQRHYGSADLAALQNTWLAWVAAGFPAPPAVTASATSVSGSLASDRGGSVPSRIWSTTCAPSRAWFPGWPGDDAGRTVAGNPGAAGVGGDARRGWHVPGAEPHITETARPQSMEPSRQTILQ